MADPSVMDRFPAAASAAIAHYWRTRSAQQTKQAQTGEADQGLRSAVTGGAQMDGIILWIRKGIVRSCRIRVPLALHSKTPRRLTESFLPTRG